MFNAINSFETTKLHASKFLWEQKVFNPAEN
jgi:hypothetical protein